jgi:hypothetical protein
MAAGQSGFWPAVGLVPAPPVLGEATSRVSGGGGADWARRRLRCRGSGLDLGLGARLGAATVELRLRLRGWALAVLAGARPWAQAQK